MYDSFVGLEVHIQLLTRTKAFCGCRAAFGDEPNTNVCPVCMGYPGVLPALNAEAIRMGYLVARALGCTLTTETRFDRKNYFYPDMPKNYQISQFRSPLGTDGAVEIELRQRKKRIRIREVHLEEDAGKMIHAGDITLLDFNRAGTPLLEIVTLPDMEVGEEAEVFLQGLRRIVRYLGVCDGNMEEGSLRCDANVSVNLSGQGLGTKVEVKNLNSFKFVRKAISFEISRQQEILQRNGVVAQETRLWNENRDVTEGMRSKEGSADYRYFPEPDLPPFVAGEEFLRSVDEALVELPSPRMRRLAETHGLSEEQASLLCEEKEFADFFEQTLGLGADPQSVAAWMASDVRKHLNRAGVSLSESPLTAARLAELLSLLAAQRIHGKIAKAVLEAVFEEDKDPLAIIKEKGWEQITDPAVIGQHIDKVMAGNASTVAAIRKGDSRRIAHLVGEIMKATSGRADPVLVQSLIREKLAMSVVQILSMGGAIMGRLSDRGEVSTADPAEIMKLVESEGRFSKSIASEQVEVGRILSEDITPDDWARLVASLDERLRSGKAAGIVVAHGTDTLAYTSSLLFWIFSRPPIPIVLTASLMPPGAPESDAIPNLRLAVRTACEARPGVYVVYGGKVLSPVNLKFERVSVDGFRNWNMTEPIHAATALFDELTAAGDRDRLRARIEAAADSTLVVRVYPGMRGDSLVHMMDKGIRNFVLELYDTGTANLSESPYSLRHALAEGIARGVRFFCTSQQEGIVDFSGYASAHELWREGAVPMGFLTTESAYTRLIACLAFCESEEEARQKMERIDANARL